MDNLIAEGKTKPFIIVMTYGMTNDTQPGGIRNFDIKPFETVLVDELIPYTDANFRTLSDQPNRAMAGLSMGGMETKTITLKHLEKFSHIGLFSGGSISPDDISDMAAFKQANNSFSSATAAVKSVETIPAVVAIPRRTSKRSKKPGLTVTTTSPRKRLTNGKPGGAVCASLPRCFSTHRVAAKTNASGAAKETAPIAAKENISGIWKAEFDSQIGRQKYTYTLKQDGANLTGKANSEVGDRKREARVEGRQSGRR